ncbi:AMP-binding protein [Endozoicomonas gorgoniicola]|uniref:Long-chain-fatty-acid--CoA ligase n=1 Tax=Endozoicomonas gorgoniicola TaxID=1234144 RepID=A0ABT3MXI6_9GAMM|nr:AMP-binding protein [Endozoicomonas gorgoniicola]MCW7554096.1 AMP-binding protein [Endozoicomonas gorgoniicola]
MLTVDTFPELLEVSFSRFRDNPAFTFREQTLTYGDVDRLSACFAQFLQECPDLNASDRVAVQLSNTLYYPVAVFGVLRAGMILVNINPRYTAPELERQLKDSGARGLVTSVNGINSFTRISTGTDVRLTVIVDELSPCPLSSQQAEHSFSCSSEKLTFPPAIPGPVYFHNVLALRYKRPFTPDKADPSDVLMLQYTSGTTGVPKGAMLTHRNIVSNTQQMLYHLSEIIDFGSEKFVAPLPLYHIYGFSKHCMLLIAAGGHSLLIDKPGDTHAVVNIFKRFNVTGLVGLATLFNQLCQSDDFTGLDFSHLKITLSGGMPLPADIAERWQSITGCVPVECYGMTEASPVISMNPPDNLYPGTVGIALRGTCFRIVDNNGEDVPHGSVGELVIRGPQVMKGYWQKKKETKKVISDDNWLLTGDMVQLCEDDYIRIVNRKNDVVNVSGFKIHLAEVETVALKHPYISEAVAVGVPSEKSGEAIKLYVVKKSGMVLSVEDIIHFCQKYLTAYKVPSLVEFRNTLPKSGLGKILRHVL